MAVAGQSSEDIVKNHQLYTLRTAHPPALDQIMRLLGEYYGLGTWRLAAVVHCPDLDAERPWLSYLETWDAS